MQPLLPWLYQGQPQWQPHDNLNKLMNFMDIFTLITPLFRDGRYPIYSDKEYQLPLRLAKCTDYLLKKLETAVWIVIVMTCILWPLAGCLTRKCRKDIQISLKFPPILPWSQSLRVMLDQYSFKETDSKEYQSLQSLFKISWKIKTLAAAGSNVFVAFL